MCGRYNQITPIEELRKIFGFTGQHNLPARYNIAPTQNAPVIAIGKSGKPTLTQMHWGLVPPWAEDTRFAAKMINARAETVHEKPSFRQAFQKRRCLIPANGFYEWQKAGETKTPWHIHLADNRPFFFAGLWDMWKPDAHSAPHLSYTVITTAASAKIQDIHPRMPVIIADKSQAEQWLTPNQPPANLQEVLKPYANEDLCADTISPRVGNIRNDDPDLITPLAPIAALL